MKQMIVLVALSLVLLTDAKDLRSQGEDDLEKRLRDLTESEEPLAVQRGVCETQYVKVGCYRDERQNRALNKLLFTDRSLQDPQTSGRLINWNDYEVYLKSLTCRCAKATKDLGYTHFGLQYYGECFSAPHASRTYANYGKSSACINRYYHSCNAEDAQECVGKANANFIFRIPEEGSGNGQVDYNAYDA